MGALPTHVVLALDVGFDHPHLRHRLADGDLQEDRDGSLLAVGVRARPARGNPADFPQAEAEEPRRLNGPCSPNRLTS